MDDGKTRDVISSGPQAVARSRRLSPRAATLVAVAGLAALAVVVITASNGRHQPIASPGVLPGSRPTISTDIAHPDSLADSSGGLWIASWHAGLLERINPVSGNVLRIRIGPPNGRFSALAAAGDHVYVLRGDTGRLEVRDSATGATLTSRTLPGDANTIAANSSGVFVAVCCLDSRHPLQTVLALDPVTLRTRHQVSDPQEGQSPTLVRGVAGVWLLSEDGSRLLRADIASAPLALPDGPLGSLAVGDNLLVGSTHGGDLEGFDPSSGRLRWVISPTTDGPVRSLALRDGRLFAITGATVTVVNVGTHRVVSRAGAQGASLLTQGIHGVWGTGPNVLISELAPVI